MNSDTNAPVHDATQVGQLLGIEYTAEQLAAFGPPPEPLAGFVTFFDPGWSILRLREAVAGKGTIFYPQTWYDLQDFAKLEDRPRYRQVRGSPLPGSFDKTFADQQALLADAEEVPPARAVVALSVIHFLATRQRLFESCYVRTADRDSGRRRVIVGDFDRGGLDVGYYWGDDRSGGIGVAVARKVP